MIGNKGGSYGREDPDKGPRWYVCDRCAEMTSSDEAYMDDDGVYCETCGRTVRIAREAGMEVPK
jgi:DNA-directed RNA polymerase subunit RPC12/RpoP